MHQKGHGRQGAGRNLKQLSVASFSAEIYLLTFESFCSVLLGTKIGD